MPDPEKVVVGAEFLEAKEFVLYPIRKAVAQKITQKDNPKIDIAGSSFFRYSVALGTTPIILRKIFQDASVDHVVAMNRSV